MHQFGFLHAEYLQLIRSVSQFSFVSLFQVVVLQGFKNAGWAVADSKYRRMGFTKACGPRISSGLGLTLVLCNPSRRENPALLASSHLRNPYWQVVSLPVANDQRHNISQAKTWKSLPPSMLARYRRDSRIDERDGAK